METTSLVNAFRCLPTNDSRQQALGALMNELTPYEWRTLQSITSARSFQVDIVGRLPVELVPQIFSYLDVATPYRLQLVSRRWCHILRSLDVLKRSLNGWYHGTVDLQGADYALYERKAQDIQAFRTGNPRSRFMIKFSDDASYPVLSGNTLIWRPPQVKRLMYALDLSTWRLTTLRGAAREYISKSFVSDQLVAFVTMTNVFYVSELNGQGQRSFTLPSCEYCNAVTIRGRTVACATHFDDRVFVYIWDYDTQQGKSFDIRRPSPLVKPCDGSGHISDFTPGIKLLVQPESKSIIIVSDNYCFFGQVVNTHSPSGVSPSRPPTHIMCSRFSYTGECIQAPHTILTQCNLDLDSFIPIGLCGLFEISVHVTGPGIFGNTTCVRMLFDEHLGRFTDARCPLTGAMSESSQYVACWNDTSYKTWIRDINGETQVLEFGGTNDYPDSKPLDCIPSRFVESRYGCPNTHTLMLLNDRYVIRTGTFAFRVFCFDESSERPKQSGPLFDFGTIIVDDDGEDLTVALPHS
ncbi:hypothetical protein P153DRAFT_428236 [Dothidotthia symphoricarpi CBS 119687]|uniref:F-box domain-containing protein n=1 Tax=Dothidotthia symphoricarpi CBS 119687 TaxID=1392245 RepID=A0A6A6AMJ5_9PLEO|nr:uncharacterized protein P153DRAFT_428236 [Dothidotthia symphoricarpi CBS 119687]KAF2133202.1 hypothetical protein P153DRAFT_428236 [Dothidotthia symphoricarpi CBS 119687]